MASIIRPQILQFAVAVFSSFVSIPTASFKQSIKFLS